MMGFKSDVRKNVDIVKMRLVCADFTCETRLMDIHTIDGSKKALDKAQQFKAALDEFAGDAQDIKNVMRRAGRSMTTDGEAAELLSQRFIKELDILPELTVFLRCSLHALTRSLENALKSDKHCNDLLEMFVLKLVGSQNGQHGAFARAVKNSEKLKHQFGEDVAKAVTGIANEVSELGAICSKATRRGGSINMSISRI